MITVLLVDDHARFRHTVHRLLDSEADIRVVGEAANGPEAMSAVERLKPDVLVVDVEMPGFSGLQVTRRVRSSHPEIRIVALSLYDDEQFRDAMRDAGASAFVRKDEPFASLCAAIRRED